VILRIVAPLFAIAAIGLLALNSIVFFFRRRKFLLGVLITILAVLVQWAFWVTVVSFDKCLDVFPYLAVIESIVLLLLTIKTLLQYIKERSMSAQSLL
jgi:hypothetical protein